MKADKIVKNAKIYTADKDRPLASALVVKDGKFAYVGDEAGLADFEGEVCDLGGKFVMPGIIDSHIHITTSVGFEYADLGLRFEPDGKQDALDFMEGYVKEHPGQKRYRFFMERKYLKGEDLYMEELDAICPDAELVLLEGEVHSNWANSKVYELHGITDDTPDPVPGLAYYVRKDGHLTGNSFESASWVFVFDSLWDMTDEQIDGPLVRWIDYCKAIGVSGVFDAGWPMHNEIHERIYDRLKEFDEQGKLPVYVDGCYVLSIPAKKDEALAELERFHKKYDSEHLKVHTLKIFMDGTMKIETRGAGDALRRYRRERLHDPRGPRARRGHREAQRDGPRPAYALRRRARLARRARRRGDGQEAARRRLPREGDLRAPGDHGRRGPGSLR